MQIGRNEAPLPLPGSGARMAPKEAAPPEGVKPGAKGDRFEGSPAPMSAAEALPRTEGVGDHWLSKLPSPLRFGVIGGLRVGDRSVDWVRKKVLRQADPALLNPSSPKERAEATWKTIEDRYGIPGLKGLFAEADRGDHALEPATVWPHGQAIAAALDVAQLTEDYSKVDATMKALSAYVVDGAYGPSTMTINSRRLWDDNAWIALDFLQAHKQTGNKDYLKHAEDLFPFMEKGLHKDGGIYWEENNARPTRNTCANAPAIQYAAKLYQETKNPRYLEFAKNLDKFMNEQLRSPEGLYYDNLGDDGKLDRTVWSYNQGAAIGANLQMYQVTGDPAALERARQTANAALEHFGKEDRLWKQPPAFNAIFFRNLLALDAVAPDPRYRQVMEGYVDRVWKDGRDPNTGELNRGGIGTYSPPGLLDQSGLAQMTALLAWPKDKLHQVS